MADRPGRRTASGGGPPPWAALAVAFGAAASLLLYTIPVFERYTLSPADLYPEIRDLIARREAALAPFRFQPFQWWRRIHITPRPAAPAAATK